MKKTFFTRRALISCLVLLLLLAVSLPMSMTTAKYRSIYPDKVSATVKGSTTVDSPDDSGSDLPSIVEETPNTVYQVQPGDTLSAIAEKFHTTVDALAAYNLLDDTNAIQAGIILRIPPADYVIPETDVDETSSSEPATGTDTTETTPPSETPNSTEPDISADSASSSEPTSESEPSTEAVETLGSAESESSDGDVSAEEVTNDGTE